MKIYLENYGKLPTRAHETDAGLDLYSPVNVAIRPGQEVVIGTGVHIQLPEKTVGFIKARSSMFSAGVITDGTIDEGYTGEIKVVLFNISSCDRYIHDGDRIAQLVVCPIYRQEIYLTNTPLDSTDRGDSGFGGSGR